MKVQPSHDKRRLLAHNKRSVILQNLTLWFCNLELGMGRMGLNLGVVSSKPTVPKVQQKRVRGKEGSYPRVLSTLSLLRALGFILHYWALRDSGL